MIKQRLLLFFCSCLLSMSSFAQSISLNEAREVAKNQLLLAGISNAKSGTSKSGALKLAPLKRENIQLRAAKAEVENKDTLYYVLNDSVNNAFVIVSADKRAWPILAYSLHGTFNKDKQPEAFVSWMENRKKEIVYGIENNLPADTKTSEKWRQLTIGSNASQTASVEPLLKTTWNQGCYYNELCPADAQGVCGHTWTGCDATAMAQIMKFWNYPTIGNGTYSYEFTGWPYGILSADFGSTTYQWDQMPDNVTSPNNAVATLMYHCGISLKMGYNVTGSGSRKETSDALVTYFDYSKNFEFLSRSDYTIDNWANILRSELDLGFPIYYCSVSANGHAFICDGYQSSDYFHFNWGWGGADDGYYYIGNLNPSGSNFNQSEGAMIKIRPNHLPNGYKGIFLSTNSIVLGPNEGYSSPINICVNSSVNWTASSDQSWLTLSTSGESAGTSTLNLTTTENNTDSTRTAVVTISAEGYPKQYISIKQFRYVETQAGNLHNIISNELATTTNLTLRGIIDARDFKTMRDKMPMLTKLDMSNVAIAEYNGVEGPAGNSNILYPASTIPNNAFNVPGTWQSNTLMNALKLPASLTAIGNNAFFNCRGIYDIVLPLNVTSIGESAFYNCRRLTSFKFSHVLSSIGNSAFSFCDKLFLDTIPSSVSMIGYGSFSNIKGKIIVDTNNSNYSSFEGVLYNKNKTILKNCPTSITGSFIVPSTVETIEAQSFPGDIYITDILFPSVLKQIQSGAFGSCARLKAITLPTSINYIGAFAFENCLSLTSINAKSIIPIDLSSPTSVMIFYNVEKSKALLTVPFGSKAAYQAADQWKDFVNIVEMPNQAPVANAGADQTINENSTVTLDGSLSNDPDGHTLTYKWTVPAGINLSSSVSKPIFVAPEVSADTNYTIYLEVNDGYGGINKDSVVITVKNVNKLPIANAGSVQTVNENSTVTLDGSLSNDPDGQVLTYKWTAPTGISLSSGSVPKPTFVALEVSADTNYTIYLEVNDGYGGINKDSVVITVKNVNKLPVANAGNDQTVNENSTVTLDGSLSSDPDGQALTYSWTSSDGIMFSSTTAIKPTFTAPVVTENKTYRFSLVVNDGVTNSTADEVTITVKKILPSTNNYQVKATDCSCRASNDGKIDITFAQSLTYTVTITGNGYNNTGTASTLYNLTGLAAGTYNVIITAAGFTGYQQNFTVVINQPQDLSVQKVKAANSIVQYTVSGGDNYYVSVNDQMIETQANIVNIPLNKGENRISIRTDKVCQGVYEEAIYFDGNGQITLFPNPTDGQITIGVPGKDEELTVEIAALKGDIQYKQTLAVQPDRLVHINVSGLAGGTYLVRVITKTIQGTVKMLKK